MSVEWFPCSVRMCTIRLSLGYVCYIRSYFQVFFGGDFNDYWFCAVPPMCNWVSFRMYTFAFDCSKLYNCIWFVSRIRTRGRIQLECVTYDGHAVFYFGLCALDTDRFAFGNVFFCFQSCFWSFGSRWHLTIINVVHPLWPLVSFFLLIVLVQHDVTYFAWLCISLWPYSGRGCSDFLIQNPLRACTFSNTSSSFLGWQTHILLVQRGSQYFHEVFVRRDHGWHRGELFTSVVNDEIVFLNMRFQEVCEIMEKEIMVSRFGTCAESYLPRAES